MAKPTLVTAQALEGIAALPGKEILLADDAATCVQCIDAVLAGSYAAIGSAARERVVQEFSWARHLCVVEQLLKTTVKPQGENALSAAVLKCAEQIN